MPLTKSLVYTITENGNGYSGYSKVTHNMNLKTINFVRYKKYKHNVGQQFIKKNIQVRKALCDFHQKEEEVTHHTRRRRLSIWKILN